MAGYIYSYTKKDGSQTHYIILPGKKVVKQDRRGDRFESKAHAQRVLEVIRNQIDNGDFDPAEWVSEKPKAFKKVSVDYLNDYSDKVKDGETSPSTLEGKKRYMRKYFLPVFADFDVKTIRAIHLKRFYKQLPELKAKTKLNIMSELNNFLVWCLDEEIIKVVPRFTLIKKLRRMAKEERPRVSETTHFMSEEDFENVMSQMYALDEPIFRFIRGTGCRPSEARALQKSEIDRRNNLIEIKRTWVDSSQGECLRGQAKSGSSRYVPITDYLKTIIKSIPPRLDTPFIFYNPKTGTAYTRSELRHRWKQAVKKSGIEYMSLYRATRSSFACQKLKEGFNYARVGAALGHKHESTTRRYGEIFLDTEIWE